MTSELSIPITKPQRKWLKLLFTVFVATAVGCFVYIRTHPLVFNESFFGHAHCIAQAAGSLRQYAFEHQSNYPTHTNGYGDALLLLVKEYLPAAPCFTGPGYDHDVFKEALVSNGDVIEEKCGRVYIQGLTTSSDPEIAIMFDKLPTPGGDHCHGLARLTAPPSREVVLVDGSHLTMRESKWPEFSKKQIELLVKTGFDRTAVQALYNEKGRSP
jgi:hypothetical protein